MEQICGIVNFSICLKNSIELGNPKSRIISFFSGALIVRPLKFRCVQGFFNVVGIESVQIAFYYILFITKIQ